MQVGSPAAAAPASAVEEGPEGNGAKTVAEGGPKTARRILYVGTRLATGSVARRGNGSKKSIHPGNGKVRSFVSVWETFSKSAPRASVHLLSTLERW